MTAIRSGNRLVRPSVRDRVETLAIRFNAGEVGPLAVIWCLVRLRNGLTWRQRRAEFADLCDRLEEWQTAESDTPDWGAIEDEYRHPEVWAERCRYEVAQSLDALTGVRSR